MSDYSNQFKQHSTASGKKAFEAYIAIRGDEEGHIIIGAPTLELLQAAWKRYAGSELVVETAQHVYVVKAEK